MEKLLLEVAKISEKYNTIKQKTGSYFNIFEIADISSDEVTICRVLYELLNPQGRHYQGDTYLRLFVRDVLGLSFTDQDYQSARIFREYRTTENRRIDLYIETDNYCVPIEVKIYAGDQYNQCQDYYRKAKSSDVFYLTLFGSQPSPESAGSLEKIMDECEIIGYKGIKQISFSNDIMNWLNSCISHSDTIKIAPIREILFQLKDVIAKLTWQMEGEAEMEIVNTILSSSTNITSALQIERALPMVKAKIMADLFRELKSLFESNNRKIYNYYENVFEKYYTESKRIWPCLWIGIKQLESDLTAVLCIEVEDRLYFSFGFMKAKAGSQSGETVAINDVRTQYPEVCASFERTVTNVMGEGNKSWNKIFWEYILDDKGRRYNFKYPENEPACIDLTKNNTEHAKRIFQTLNGYYERVLEKLQDLR